MRTPIQSVVCNYPRPSPVAPSMERRSDVERATEVDEKAASAMQIKHNTQ